MKRLALIAAAIALAACNPAPQPAAAKYKTVTELQEALDWQHGKGGDLQAEFDREVKALLVSQKRPADTDAIKAAGYECIFGEAHQDYPDPMAVCSKSFATRACQMDWEISTTVEKGKVSEADATYTRDCVGVADDWPEPKKSAIDDQLAPQTPPEPAAPAPATPPN